MTNDTSEALSRDLDALIDRFTKMSLRCGGAFGDDLKDISGGLRDQLTDLNFAITNEAGRAAEDAFELRGKKCPDQAYDEARDERVYQRLYGEI